jgi:hydroxymethylbilane synthase
MIAPINCADTFSAVEHEREILRSFGGGCHQKIGASVLRRSFGEVTFLRGLADDGRVLDGCSLQPAKPRPAKVSAQLLWPVNSADSDWFTREPISVEDSLSLSEAVSVGEYGLSPSPQPSPRGRGSNALWIAKADALPDDWPVPADQIVWASGLQTWRRLARRGVWVNGCAESLGEQEAAGIETLAGEPLNWLKLTHDDGYADGEMPVAATYRLIPKTEAADLHGKRYFFWKSGSSFERALELNPRLAEMTHFCGPGNTQRILERHGVTPHVFLDHQQWLDEMSE